MITVENTMQFLTVIGQFVIAYVLLPYDFVCAIIIHHFFHRFHGHLQNIFCTHLTQVPYDALSGNLPLHKAHVFIHSTWLITAILHQKMQTVHFTTIDQATTTIMTTTFLKSKISLSEFIIAIPPLGSYVHKSEKHFSYIN